ncbi:hypothetical protein EV426DRAFT_706415 [Tirmania nivea]|nr:hypothetical protein EV426DRAFT_706415 [Tirmania nivea]
MVQPMQQERWRQYVSRFHDALLRVKNEREAEQQLLQEEDQQPRRKTRSTAGIPLVFASQDPAYTHISECHLSITEALESKQSSVVSAIIREFSCTGEVDGVGGRWEQIWEDPEWCEKLATALRR